MTTYAVQADLLQRLTAAELVQLTDDARSGTVNAAIVSGALVEATGQIDSYVRARYQTPLQTSSTATRLCRDIAVYLLYQRRPQQMKDTVRQAYEDAVSFLKDIATGKAQLDQPSGAPVAQTPTAGGIAPTNQHLRFGKCNLEGWD